MEITRITTTITNTSMSIRTTIPKSIREHLKITDQQYMVWDIDESGNVIVKVAEK